MPLLDFERAARPSSPGPGRGQRPFLYRHFWPPSWFGILVLAVVVSVLAGMIGGYVYTQSESAKVELQDPAGPEPIADGVPTTVATAEPATTTTQAPLSVAALGDRVAPSVFHVSTLDEAGRPVESSALVAGSFGGQSLLLAPFSVVRASTRVPGPEIVVRSGGAEAKATLWTWQEERDLALLVIPQAAPPLLWATDDPEGKPGQKVFVAAAGAGLAGGRIESSSPTAIVHDVPTDDRRQGGPLINEKGEVLGMASLEYNPGGVGTDKRFVAVPIRAACGPVLDCGGGNTQVEPASPPPE